MSERANPKPSKGRVVIYTYPNGVERPADVVQTCLEAFPGSSYERDECQLAVKLDANDMRRSRVLDSSGEYVTIWRPAGDLEPFPTSVPYDASGARHSWRWPPRV